MAIIYRCDKCQGDSRDPHAVVRVVVVGGKEWIFCTECMNHVGRFLDQPAPWPQVGK